MEKKSGNLLETHLRFNGQYQAHELQTLESNPEIYPKTIEPRGQSSAIHSLCVDRLHRITEVIKQNRTAARALENSRR